MRGLMMDRPLLIASLIDNAARYHGDADIVSRTVEGGTHRYTYAEAAHRAKRLAQALMRLGIGEGDRVATLAWNGYRHFELYFGISGIGAICHTVNPRLFHEQIRYIVNHAEDRLLFLDLTFVPLVEKLAAQLRPVRHFVVMTDRAHMPPSSLPNMLCYEEMIEAEDAGLAWPSFDENTASSLCYTSGTTGNPKGALFSHRSTVLHAFSSCMVDFLALSSHETVCPVVPMFHVNSWAFPMRPRCAGQGWSSPDRISTAPPCTSSSSRSA
jgi:fatty-acyl-CoA synthase